MREPRDRLFTSALVALTAADLAYFTAAGVLIGVTPFFAAGPLGAGAAGVGLAVGAFSVTTLVLRPLAGRWSDRYGRRPLLIGGAGLFAILIGGHLLVTDLAWLVGLRVLLGVAEAVFFVAGFAALADLAPPGRAGEALSYSSLALYFGVAGGPLVGQALLGWGGFGWVWVGAALCALVAAVFAARVPETRQPSDAVLAAWREVYRAPEHHWALYELAEKLVDFEDYFRRWRFNHVTTVERIIGLKRGTGGTGGVSYLRKMLEVELFPELWHVRTEL